MPIETETPVVVPAKPSMTYNEVWIRGFMVSLGGCNGEPTRLSAVLGLVGRDETGKGNFLDGFNRNLEILDIFAEDNPQWQGLLVQVMGALISKAKAKGLLELEPPAPAVTEPPSMPDAEPPAESSPEPEEKAPAASPMLAAKGN